MYSTTFRILFIIGRKKELVTLWKNSIFLHNHLSLVFEIGKIKIKNTYPVVCLLSVKFKNFKYIIVNEVSKYYSDIPSY